MIIIADKFPAGDFILVVLVKFIPGYLAVTQTKTGIAGGFDAFARVRKATETAVLEGDEGWDIAVAAFQLRHRAGDMRSQDNHIGAGIKDESGRLAVAVFAENGIRGGLHSGNGDIDFP